MGVHEIRWNQAMCDYCRDRSSPYVGHDLPEGWIWKPDVCYGSDHYYKDGYTCNLLACPKCSGIKDTVEIIDTSDPLA